MFATAARCLSACEIEKKLYLTQHAAQAWRDNLLSLQPDGRASVYRRPARPVLVLPGDVPKRRMSGKDGFAALIHALTHIEFNAINLAWDAAYRFRHLPRQFYNDWVKAADEEAYHF